MAVTSRQPLPENMLSPVLHRAQFPIFPPVPVAHMEDPPDPRRLCYLCLVLQTSQRDAKTYSDICKKGRRSFSEQQLRAACKGQEWRTPPLLQDPVQEGDKRWAGLRVHLAAGLEVLPASLCASGHTKWAPGWGWRLLCSLDVGLAPAGSLTLGGWEGILIGAVMRPGICAVC